MKRNSYISIAQLAKVLGISRTAVYKKVKAGKIKAIRIGRSFAIPTKYIKDMLGDISKEHPLKEKEKKGIEKVVKKAVDEYGETLKLLGNE